MKIWGINREQIWIKMTIGKKLALEIIFITMILFGYNCLIYSQVNKVFIKMDHVYGSNISITELSDTLDYVNDSTYEYLTVKSSASLEDYYRYEITFQKLLTNLNNKKIENTIKILEKNIRAMSETYLKLTSEAIQAKRGRNIEKYKSLYEESQRLYQYIRYQIYDLNSQQFKQNGNTYKKLQDVMKYMEISNLIILIIVMLIGVIVLVTMTKEIVAPLKNLVDTAYLVGEGNFHVKIPYTKSKDEIGIVTVAFNKMVDNLEEYMRQIRESMEREILMEAHLKEAQFKFFQSQISPHFLFNSLNAGAQLAMIEDAERTCLFLEKMAEFFRYNVKKNTEDAFLKEEIEAVDHYIYILNVRFAGDIEYRKEIDKTVENYKIPSMILQPLVENAVNHGIRNIEWKGKISLSIKRNEKEICITICDNGVGIEKEKIQSILEDNREETISTGVGIYNVRSRLELYYKKKDIIKIYSEGMNRGTEVVLLLPIKEEKINVSNTISR